MKVQNSSSRSQQQLGSLMNIGRRSLSPTGRTQKSKNKRVVLPTFLFGIYLLLLWLPPDLLPLPAPRWYLVLGLAFFAFFLHGRMLDMRAARIFWVVYGLSFLGAVLSLWRAPNFDQALWNTLGFGIGFVTFLLFIPVLATRFARRWTLILLVVTAFLWSYEIQRLVRIYRTLIYSTFGRYTGDNKNAIGFLLTLAGIALLYLAIFWKPSPKFGRFQALGIRLVCVFSGVFLIYNLALIYARGGLVTAFTGIFAILVLVYIRSPRRLGILRVGFAISILFLLIILLIPKITTVSYQWSTIFYKIQTEGVSSFSTRQLLISKASYLISQNPFIGVGIGGSRPAIETYGMIYPSYLIHNLYLTDWADKGILGLLSYFVWFVSYIKFSRKYFLKLPLIDQLWMLLVFVLFVEIIFKDSNTSSYILLLIYTGIIYEQYQID